MKKYFFAIASISLLFTACNKQEKDAPVEQKSDVNNAFIFKAYVDDEVTKTTYSWNSGTSKYDFSWLNGDKIQVQVKHKTTANSYDAIVGSTTSTGTQATFSSVDGYTSTDWAVADYAFYPAQYPTAPSNHYDAVFEKYLYYGTYQTDLLYGKGAITELTPSDAASATTPIVRLFGTITEDANYPMRHIPMIGKKDGDGNFAFKAATGVLKVTLANLPTTATQIRLLTNAYNLNGYFVFDKNSEIKESYATAGYQLKYMNISINAAAEDTNNDGFLDAPRSFYFPVPTGTITTGDLQVVVSDGTKTLCSVANKQDIPITRGVVTELPTITMYTATTTVGGTASAITATIGFTGGTDNVKVVLAESISAGETLIEADDAAVQSLAAAGTTTPLSATNVSGSKQCYVVVRSYNASNKHFTYGIPVYSLSSSDLAKYITASPLAMTGGPVGGSGSITFSESDDPTKGQLVLEEFDGMTRLAANTGLALGHPFFTTMNNGSGTYWFGGVGDCYVTYALANVEDGDKYIGKIESSSIVFNYALTSGNYNGIGPAFFKYNVNGSEATEMYLFTDTGDYQRPFTFTISGSTLTASNVKLRFYGDYCKSNGSASSSTAATLNGSKGTATKLYASSVTVTIP